MSQKSLKLQPQVTQFELSKITVNNLSKFDVSATSKLILISLSTFYNPNKAMFPKQQTMANQLGISIASVKRAIKELTEKGYLVVEVKYSNHYKFTPKFFETIGLSYNKAQTDTLHGISLSPHEQISKQKNNRPSKFKNQSYGEPLETPSYLSASKIVQTIENDKKNACSPLDFTKEEQIEYYNNLPAFLKTNSTFAKEIKKRWDL